jgi:dihydrofolate reductase
MPTYHAIAAMSENRVIGNQGKIPWHIPEDFRWFKHKTMGGTLIMGRKTFESIGKPLPGRETVVLSRGPQEQLSDRSFIPHQSFVSYAKRNASDHFWVCGGAQIYEQMLPRCSVLYLTRVTGMIEGDAKMPPFENRFSLDQTIHETDKFRIERWKKIGSQKLPLETWPDFSTMSPSSPGSKTPGKVTYCLYLADDWKVVP